MATAENYCEPEGPIIELLKTLASRDLKEMAIISDSKLIEILKKDFYMDTTVLHKFEMDVYVNVLKEHIKKWPGWDNCDRNINRIKTIKDKAAVAMILKKEYVKLKEYLQHLLNVTQELAADKVSELKEKENLKKEQIVMEVFASRQQMNNLFYRYPVRNNIFNINVKRRKLNMQNTTLKSILNWYGVEITIKVPMNDKWLVFERRNSHKLRHALMNKKLSFNMHKNIKLDQNALVKLPEHSIKILKSQMLKIFDKAIYENPDYKYILPIIEYDLVKLPKTLNIPFSLRRYTSKYSFIRYLYSDVPLEDNLMKYDIQLEEIISPMCEFNIDFSDLNDSFTLDNPIKVICTECDVTFTNDFMSELLNHFKNKHYEDPDWICMNCKKVCPVKSLTNSGWNHACELV
ncbi:PREDICTED: uncharacterized protein LOC106100054 [Papilio polytes]|uniref:uncharacterized protein LOC106100054 n=1 Tax=Papilio polytes TaxID=76194 RepID=UPI0006765A8A|nr:PREDICTED: uncharacterized protein LOC106100054 [Papilio polytes]